MTRNDVSYSGIVEDDVLAGHVAMKNVLLQMLNQCTLKQNKE